MNLNIGTDSLEAETVINLLKQKEILETEFFLENNPEVNLPSDLNLESLANDFPPLVSEKPTPLRESPTNESWVSIVSKDKPTTAIQ